MFFHSLFIYGGYDKIMHSITLPLEKYPAVGWVFFTVFRISYKFTNF